MRQSSFLKVMTILVVLSMVIILSNSIYVFGNGENEIRHPCLPFNKEAKGEKRGQYLSGLVLTATAEARRLYSLGKCDEAVSVHRRSIQEIEKPDYEDYPRLVAWHYGALGIMADQCGKLQEAVDAYTRAIEIYEHASAFSVASVHAMLLADLMERFGNLASAETYYRKAIYLGDLILEEGKDCSHYRSIDARTRLLEFYRRYGRNQKAAELANELTQLRECPFPIQEDETMESLEQQ